jgi:soluble lytic murein transglycosylase-like protein
MMTQRTKVLALLAATLAALFFWSTGTALAEEIGLRLRRPSGVLSSAPDPQQFLQELVLVPPRPVIALTIEDAVAQELLREARGMAEVDALRTAQALCEEAALLGYDPFILLALIKVESGFNPFAISRVGAEGLMQLMPDTASWMAETTGMDSWSHSFDPVLNVRLGARYLKHLHERFGRLDLALTAYNRGPTNTRALLRRFGKLPDSVLAVYAGKVLKRYDALRATYGQLIFG